MRCTRPIEGEEERGERGGGRGLILYMHPRPSKVYQGKGPPSPTLVTASVLALLVEKYLPFRAPPVPQPYEVIPLPCSTFSGGSCLDQLDPSPSTSAAFSSSSFYLQHRGSSLSNTLFDRGVVPFPSSRDG